MYKNDWRFHNKRNFKAWKTRNGRLALWERGGVTKDGGTATLLATPSGKKPNAMSVMMYNNINGKHALVQVNRGTIIVWGKIEYGTVNIQIYVVRRLHFRDSYIEAKRVNELYHGDWEYPLEDRFEKVVEAMQKKLSMVGCSVPIYAKIPPQLMEALKP